MCFFNAPGVGGACRVALMLAVNFLRFLGEVWASFGGSWVVAGAAKSERVKGGGAVVAAVTGALKVWSSTQFNR